MITFREVTSRKVLEGIVDNCFPQLGISVENRESIESLLKVIELKDFATYLHSLRTGLLATTIANCLGKNPKPMFYDGRLHDIGKITIDNGTLNKVDCFDKMDLEKMKAHVINGYNILKGIHPFSAEILLWHHYFKPHDPYPTDAELRELQSGLPELLKKRAKEYGLKLAFADVYDAMLTRKNFAYGNVIKPAESERFMLEAFKEHNMSHKEILGKLYDQGVLGINYSIFFKRLKEKGIDYFKTSTSADYIGPQPD